MKVLVHCRTGSSENVLERVKSHLFVHCRTGSSETITHSERSDSTCSLPHRQLRKA